MNELEDTQPMQLIKLGWDVNGDGEISEVEEKIPEPAILRACLFALANLVGLVAGHEFLTPELLDRLSTSTQSSARSSSACGFAST